MVSVNQNNESYVNCVCEKKLMKHSKTYLASNMIIELNDYYPGGYFAHSYSFLKNGSIELMASNDFDISIVPHFISHEYDKYRTDSPTCSDYSNLIVNFHLIFLNKIIKN